MLTHEDLFDLFRELKYFWNLNSLIFSLSAQQILAKFGKRPFIKCKLTGPQRDGGLSVLAHPSRGLLISAVEN